MTNTHDQHNLAISRCGVPLIAELLDICLRDPEPVRVGRALIWLGLLHGLEELGPALASAVEPRSLKQDQKVALYAAMHLTGNPARASLALHRLLGACVVGSPEAGEATSEAGTVWQVMNRMMELANRSPHAELIRQASLLHLTDPAALLEDWLAQLDGFIAARMPFAALLRLSILCRNPQDLPDGFQLRLAEAITAFGNLADAIPLYRFWMVACQVVPNWDFACIRAADLALRFEDFAIADHLLERLEPINIKNPWLYDVKARCRYGYGDLHAAARLWSEALAKVISASPERQVFHDRMLSALRGKFGLAEACRLARAGQIEAALALLQLLILHDPSFANHYRSLASLQEGMKQEQRLTIEPDDGQMSVVHLIDSCRPLWLESEGGFQPSDDPEQVRSMVQKAAELLDHCEQSLPLTTM
jgi:tetratricopeptide (TPR) repeat protein